MEEPRGAVRVPPCGGEAVKVRDLGGVNGVAAAAAGGVVAGEGGGGERGGGAPERGADGGEAAEEAGCHCFLLFWWVLGVFVGGVGWGW